VKWYGKYGRKARWIVKVWKKRKLNSEKIWKIRRKLWNDMENMEEK
jgi:hypothetical protein